jgi:hypothetical protein
MILKRYPLTKSSSFFPTGVIASLIDTVVVGPLMSALDAPPRKLLTIDLHVH